MKTFRKDYNNETLAKEALYRYSEMRFRDEDKLSFFLYIFSFGKLLLSIRSLDVGGAERQFIKNK